ncbi:hypothetical protein FRC09_000523 [Ceratobasidium sp. 395]|nr:hypothetical protein FRC09_000523 [Ceratobasidium sp. 395]
MILNSFKATINTPEGDQLPEYQTKRTDENTIECWIPSTEGKNFEIGSKAPSNEHPGLSVRCKPQLDGVSFQNLVRLSANIGEPFKCRGQTTSTSSIRLFSFGKRLLTDKEDIAPSKGSPQKDLNTIRVTFEWGEAGIVQPQTNFWVPKENGPIHEKVAKKGHSGSAGLGSASSLQYSPTVVSFFEPARDIQPVVFVFRYAPEDWLQAQGIIPPKNLLTQKRDRDATPDIIDIDNLETDDEDVTLVKHLVPANTSSKRQKVKDESETK